MLRSLLALGIGLIFAESALADAPSYDYDASKSAKLTLGAARTVDGVVAQDVSFKSSTGNVVKGELVTGSGSGSHPAVLFVHWLGEPATTNHTEFEPDAIALAKKGVTSLLVDTMWSAPKWFDGIGKSADADVRATENQVIDLRRALDVLAGQPGVDSARIAYVGHDFGAMFGALLSSVDTRPSVYVLMAGIPVMTDWYLLGKKIPDQAGYLAKLSPFDIAGALSKSKATAYLFQFASHDDYISREQAEAFASAAPLPRGAFLYDTDHSLAIPAARADRQAWLEEHLLRN